MTEDQFDLCPSCGAVGTFGLRCHPKFAVVAVTPAEGDMVVAYAHTEADIRSFARHMPDVLHLKRWNPDLPNPRGGKGRWEDFDD